MHLNTLYHAIFIEIVLANANLLLEILTVIYCNIIILRLIPMIHPVIFGWTQIEVRDQSFKKVADVRFCVELCIL